MQIHLIRHGQANASGLNYDKLTEKGVLQAKNLGKRLAENGFHFSIYGRGSLVRHRETLEGILDGMAGTSSSSCIHSMDSAQLLEQPGLNEVDPETWKALAQEIAAGDASFAGMLEQLKDSEGSRRRRRLAAVTGRVLDFWIRGQSDEFQEFRRGVLDSLQNIASHRGSGPALVVSSGTPIAIAIAEAMGQSAPEFIFHWLRHLSNTSYSILDISSGWKALQVNSLDHLKVSDRSLM